MSGAAMSGAGTSGVGVRAAAEALTVPAAAFRRERPIRFSHCDPAGILYYPNYFDFCNGLVEDWFGERLGLDYARQIGERRIGLPTVSLAFDFLRPSRMGERLSLALLVEELGRSSLALRILGDGAADGARRLAGRQVLVCTSLEDHRPIPLPDDVRAAVEAYRRDCDA